MGDSNVLKAEQGQEVGLAVVGKVRKNDRVFRIERAEGEVKEGF